MTVWCFNRADNKGDVEFAIPNKSDCLGGSAFCDDLFNLWVGSAETTAQIGEKAKSNGGVQPDSEPSFPAAGNRAYGSHGVVEMVDVRRHFGDEAASGLGQPDTAMAPLKQEDTKSLLKRLDPRADA